MTFRTLALAAVLPWLSLSASATDLGTLTPLPVTQMLQIAAPDVTFSSQYHFFLSEDAHVSALATNLVWSLSTTSILDIGDFRLQLFDGVTHEALAMPTQQGDSWRIDGLALSAGHYHLQVSGTTLGSGGGSYALSAITSVQEPSELALMAAGMAAMGGLVVRRRRAHGSLAHGSHN